MVAVVDYSVNVLLEGHSSGADWVAQELQKEENADLNQQIENNYLLQMIASEQERGLKSVQCQCGMMTALLEKTPPYSPRYQPGLPSSTQGNLYKLLDAQYVD